jgi:hypothetical protein
MTKRKRTMTEPYFPVAFDSSIMATGKSCPQKLFLTHFEDWKPREPNVHLHAGGAFAHAMKCGREAFFVDGLDQETSVAKAMGGLVAFYGDFECPADSAKSLERMIGAVEFYFANYPLEHGVSEPILMPDGKRGIEFSASSPLPVLHPVSGDPILYCGRMDAILEYARANYVTDEKTTTSLGPTWSQKWDLRSQFTGYAWLCKQYGIEVAGSIVRGISILKTKYDTQQAIIYHPPWQLDRWLSDTCDWLEDFIGMWKRKYFRHALDDACADFGGCGYRGVCSSPDKGPWLETSFERRRWNPVIHQEVKV